MYATRARQRPPGALRRPRRHRRAPRPALHGLAAGARRRRPGRLQRLHPRPGDRCDDVPGRPRLLRRPPGDLRRARHRSGCTLLARIDYSRFRELRVGIYTFLCVSISLVFVFGFAARGSRRAFDLPFFSFQPSELGKLLLVLALAGFVIDGARRGSDEAAHGALPLPRPGPGCARLPAAGPRHLPGVRGHHPRRDVLRGRPLDALRGDRRGPRRYRSRSSSWSLPQSGRRSSRATRRRG